MSEKIKPLTAVKKYGVLGSAYRVGLRLATPVRKAVLRRRARAVLSVKTEARNVLILASVPYYDSGSAQRSAQLCKGFTAAGYNVYYIFRQHAAETGLPKVAIPAVQPASLALHSTGI